MTRADLIIAALAVALFLALASRVSLGKIAGSYVLALPFILLASASTFWLAGPQKGLEMCARVSSCTVPLLVLANGTDTFDLFKGLRGLGVPAGMTTLLMLTHRYITLFSEEMARMKIARKARGFSGGRSLMDRYGLKVLSSTAGMLLVRSSKRADLIYEGLRMRGFDENLDAWSRTSPSVLDIALTVAVVSAAMVIGVLQLGVIA